MAQDLDNHLKIRQEEVLDAIHRKDLGSLKQILPTQEALIHYRTNSLEDPSEHLDTVLHHAAKEKDVDFVKSILKSYFPLDDAASMNRKRKLLLARNANDHLCADISFFKESLRPDYLARIDSSRTYYTDDDKAAYEKRKALIDNMPDKRTEEQKQAAETFNFLKNEIIKNIPNITGDKVIASRQEISEEYGQKNGIPVMPIYFYDAKSNKNGYVETYPEIRLFAADGEKNYFKSLKGLPLDSSKSLAEQALEQMDFPEKYLDFVASLNSFEKEYKQIRKEEGMFASMRHFNANNGVFVIQSGSLKTNGNGKEGGSAGGFYAVNNDGNPVVVLQPNSAFLNIKETFKHEFAHMADLYKGVKLSSTDVLKYSLMLTEMDLNNKNPDPFAVVNNGYPADQYEKEMVAQIMGRSNDTSYAQDPLLQRIFQVEKELFLAKADENTAVPNRIVHAMDDLGAKEDLDKLYAAFKDRKAERNKKENDVLAREDNKDNFGGLISKLQSEFRNEDKKNYAAFATERLILSNDVVSATNTLLRKIAILKNSSYEAQHCVVSPVVLSWERYLCRNDVIENYITNRTKDFQKQFLTDDKYDKNAKKISDAIKGKTEGNAKSELDPKTASSYKNYLKETTDVIILAQMYCHINEVKEPKKFNFELVNDYSLKPENLLEGIEKLPRQVATFKQVQKDTAFMQEFKKDMGREFELDDISLYKDSKGEFSASTEWTPQGEFFCKKRAFPVIDPETIAPEKGFLDKVAALFGTNDKETESNDGALAKKTMVRPAAMPTTSQNTFANRANALIRETSRKENLPLKGATPSKINTSEVLKSVAQKNK